MTERVYWLVEALVDRLQRVVPEQFVVQLSPSGSGVQILERDSLPLGLVQYIEEIVEQDEAFEDNVATAVWSVLSGIQDYISEALKEPWPPNQSAPRELPVPEVGIAGGFIRAWYGSEKSPILALDPIPIPPSS